MADGTWKSGSRLDWGVRVVAAKYELGFSWTTLRDWHLRRDIGIPDTTVKIQYCFSSSCSDAHTDISIALSSSLDIPLDLDIAFVLVSEHSKHSTFLES